METEVQERLKRMLQSQDENEEEEVVVDDDKSESEFFRSLHICKKIVDMNEGKISFYANDQKNGTTFEFSMKMNMKEAEKAM